MAVSTLTARIGYNRPINKGRGGITVGLGNVPPEASTNGYDL